MQKVEKEDNEFKVFLDGPFDNVKLCVCVLRQQKPDLGNEKNFNAGEENMRNHNFTAGLANVGPISLELPMWARLS